MKNIITLFSNKWDIYWIVVSLFSTIVAFSCTKKSSAPEMTVAELKAKYKIDLVAEWEKQFSNGVARTSKPKPKAEQVITVSEDLVLSGAVSCTVSPDAEWGGIQKFLAIPLSMDGAISYCNFYWWSGPTEMNCPATSSGVYRGWTSDHDYNVHLSNLVSL